MAIVWYGMTPGYSKNTLRVKLLLTYTRCVINYLFFSFSLTETESLSQEWVCQCSCTIYQEEHKLNVAILKKEAWHGLGTELNLLITTLKPSTMLLLSMLANMDALPKINASGWIDVTDNRKKNKAYWMLLPKLSEASFSMLLLCIFYWILRVFFSWNNDAKNTWTGTQESLY